MSGGFLKMAQSAEDKEKEIKDLTLKYEIEKQKNRKLQQEMEILKQKLDKLQMQPKPASPAAAPQPSGATPQASPRTTVSAPSTPPSAQAPGGGAQPDLTQFIDTGLRDSVAGLEIEDLRSKLESLTQQYRQAEQEKWDVARKNIELKEQYQRLKVKSVNLRKDIEAHNEKLDRKENQNFKSRLEITDLKKENARSEENGAELQKQREALEKQLAELEERAEKDRQKLKEERRRRDIVHAEYQRHRDMLAEYETHWAARIYNR
jgi:DNA repair exonuclease SbcCD ATPase subunit